ncbi:hypothetical protein C2L80_08710 [Rubneribacter badeniensis]|uniref:Class I SAM-dependent methyltransferase n=2 Tax=Rubneribacter badeniensis TaxID=2070688 RepID=A0A2K2U3Z7_9ACTN|nr:hypothetical protein B5F41_12010 [Gordonibacter sp. An232A]PNV65046.1 hypothetical protein C2L80_08710 [Rubneribacter badeniensis]
MDNVTARALCAVNKRFYQRQCASFSTTRTTPWEGWQLCLEWARKARRAEGTQTGDNAGARAAHGDENTAAGIARENGNAGPQIARRSEDAGARAAQEGRNTDAEDADGKGNADARAARGDGSAKVDIARGNEGAGAGAEHESENADEQSDMRRRQGDADAKTLRSEHARPALSVLDLACGNLRFEAFLAKELADTDLAFHTADDCDALVKGAPWRPDPADGAALGNRAAGSIRWHHQSFDVLAALDAEGRSDGAALDAETPGGGPALAEALQTPRCDLAVSFGFLHHIPLPRWREEVLAMLAAKVRPGGFVIVSLWRFLENPLLARKAEATHEHALAELGLPPLDAGDRLLGWRDEPGAYRYCHSFTDGEIDALAASVGHAVTEVARFRADGRDGALNSYLVLQVE